MVLNIIFDERRVEKYEPLIKELKRQEIVNYEIWPCVILPDVVQSINASHKKIVRWAKENKLKEVCIAEDDVGFIAKDGWEYFIRNKPVEYDLYLAATYVKTSPLKHICGFHLYCVHSRFYDTFLSIPDNVHVDTHFDQVKGEYKFCYPFAAIQRPGFSANNMAVVNYNAVLKPEDIYTGGEIYNF